MFSIKTVGSFRILPEEAVLSRGSCSYKRSACCSRVVLSKLLAARKANFLSLLVLGKKIAVLTCSRMLAKTIRHPLYSVAITHYQSPLTHQHEQHITLRQSIDRRTVEWQFCFLKHKLYIVTILECRVFILPFVFPDFFGWRWGMFKIEFLLKWCGFHLTLHYFLEVYTTLRCASVFLVDFFLNERDEL